MSTFSNENHVTRGFTSDAINEFAFRLTGSPMLNIPSTSRDLADENNKILTEWK
jgi:hypothetical protein